jgi:hypothetical protein
MELVGGGSPVFLKLWRLSKGSTEQQEPELLMEVPSNSTGKTN